MLSKTIRNILKLQIKVINDQQYYDDSKKYGALHRHPTNVFTS